MTITRPFYIGTFEVRLSDFHQFIDATSYKTDAERLPEPKPFSTWRDPDRAQTKDYPVVLVTYGDVLTFCQWLSTKESRTYRLPTEAEWEYACRAGSNTAYYFGDDAGRIGDMVNVLNPTAEAIGRRPGVTFRDTFAGTSPVGQFPPNSFGLHDLHGDVWEWCQDWYSQSYYSQSPSHDPLGPADGSHRVRRGGGCWDYEFVFCRSATREWLFPRRHAAIQGFALSWCRPSNIEGASLEPGICSLTDHRCFDSQRHEIAKQKTGIGRFNGTDLRISAAPAEPVSGHTGGGGNRTP